MRISVRFAGLAALAACAASASGAQTPPASEAVALFASAPPPYVEPVLHQVIRMRGAARAVIRLRESPSAGAGAFAAAAARAEGALAAGGGGALGPLGGDLRVAELTAAQLQALIDSGAAAEIYADRLTSVAFDRRAPQPTPPAPPTSPQTPAASAGDPPPQTPQAANPPTPLFPLPPPPPPEGPAVAVIDTGVETDHPYLRGVVVRQACFSSTVAADRAKTLCPNGRPVQTLGEAARPCDPAEMGPLCGHGTKVAGIISGRGGEFVDENGGRRPIEGIAPGAPILAIQVFSRIEDPMICGAFDRPAPCPLSYVSDQIAALRFVSSVAAEHDVAAANLSLASSAPGDPCDEAFEGRQYLAEISYLLDRMGVATVAATGNSGRTDAVGMPACVSRAVAVAALDAAGGSLARFSNVSPSADLAAPGVGLASSTLGDTLYAVDEGTSFAAPQVAGALLKLKRRAPHLRIERLVELLQEAGGKLEEAPGLSLATLDLPAALARFDLALSRAAAAPAGFATAASSGGKAPLPPRIAPGSAPEILSQDILAQLRPQSPALRQAAEGRILRGTAESGDFAYAYPPAPRPAPPPPPPPVPAVLITPPSAALRAGTGGRFLFEIDPALLEAALGAERGPEAREAAMRRLALQAAPAESPVAELRLDPESASGSIAFETRLDARQAEAFAAGFPGSLAPDRLSAP